MWRLALFLLALSAVPSNAATCRAEVYADNRYVICDVDLTRDDLRLFLYDDEDTAYGYFGNLNSALKENGQQLGFAMNGGMYHDDRSPVGHYVEDGEELQRVISTEGPGNFGLLPNGVFCLQNKRAQVLETEQFLAQAPTCRSATQSGPMLVIDGDLHPRFLPDSTSRYIRNGVGTSPDGRLATFVISDTAVTFHEFGSLFRDHLGIRNALFLDGNISRVRAPDLGRSGTGFTAFGPILGVVVPAD